MKKLIVIFLLIILTTVVEAKRHKRNFTKNYKPYVIINIYQPIYGHNEQLFYKFLDDGMIYNSIEIFKNEEYTVMNNMIDVITQSNTDNFHVGFSFGTQFNWK